jgi:hypothetical protein
MGRIQCINIHQQGKTKSTINDSACTKEVQKQMAVFQNHTSYRSLATMRTETDEGSTLQMLGIRPQINRYHADSKKADPASVKCIKLIL